MCIEILLLISFWNGGAAKFSVISNTVYQVEKKKCKTTPPKDHEGAVSSPKILSPSCRTCTTETEEEEKEEQEVRG